MDNHVMNVCNVIPAALLVNKQLKIVNPVMKVINYNLEFVFVVVANAINFSNKLRWII